MKPYYADDSVTLYLGDMRDVLPTLHRVDAIVTDPPYGETSLEWDCWPSGWPAIAAGLADSMWCFGSMRMFGERWAEFGTAGWKRSQDIVGVDDADGVVYGDVTVVWEKNDGTGRAVDRFRRVHEYALHWYQGAWGDVRHQVPRVAASPAQIARNGTAARTNPTIAHAGVYRERPGWVETGTRLMRSVIRTPSMRGRARHPSEKPVELLAPLLEYACPPSGLVLDPFAGSGSTAEAARMLGRRAVLVEADERYCEAIARRLSQDVLPLEVS